MAEFLSLLGAAAGAAAGGGGDGEVDPNFNQTVLLLHGDGTNGAQNNTFLDSSTNNFTITRNGNTTQGTFSPFSAPDGRWSNYFDGTGDYLTVPDNAALDFGSGDFTIECFVYLNESTSGVTISLLAQGTGAFNNNVSWYFLRHNSDKLRFITTSNGTSSYTIVDSTADFLPSVGQWYHLAAVRSSGTIKLYADGVEIGSGSNSTTFYNSSRVIAIGGSSDGTDLINGYVSNVRIVKGTAITPPSGGPTSPLTAVSGTSLLTCQSNRFVDNSSNAFAITRNGDVKVTPFSPFAPAAAYSASVNGGSGYFDGTGDYLSIANAAALDLDANLTIEAWIYPTSLPNTFQTVIITSDNITSAGGIGIWARSTGEIQVYDIVTNSAIIDTSGFGLSINQWTHISVTRSGSTVTLYKNGASFTTGSSSSNFASSTPTLIGNSTAASQTFFGYISGVRIIKGTALAPDITQPPTAVSGTSLLLNFTNAGIFDNTGKNNLETVGNAQIDTTTKKYGTGSMEFDGTGDRLLCIDTPDNQLGTGPFTIEAWIYPTSVSPATNFSIICKGASSATGTWQFDISSTSKLRFQYDAAGEITSSASLTVNVWTHVAVVREGTGSNQTKLYINGSNDGTGTVSSNFNTTSTVKIGQNRDSTTDYPGFIDDLRITKGVARYTTTFTPPIKEFPNL